MTDDATSRDGLLPFFPVTFRTDHLSDDLFIAANYAVAFAASAMQMKKLHWHGDDDEDRRLNAGMIADSATFISKFALRCQEAIRPVSHLLTAARPSGPFTIGDFSEENAHWVAYRVGIAAGTRLLKKVGFSVRFANRDENSSVELSKIILENWDSCKDSMTTWDMPDTRNIEAAIVWEVHQAEKNRRNEEQASGLMEQIIKRLGPMIPEPRKTERNELVHKYRTELTLDFPAIHQAILNERPELLTIGKGGKSKAVKLKSMIREYQKWLKDRGEQE